MRRVALIALALATAGCSLVTDTDWAKDRPIPDGGDLGPLDMGDGGMDDLGDIGPVDMGDGGMDLEEACGIPGDEDEDGLADCADFDCLDFPGCCGAGVSLVDVTSWDTTEVNRTDKLPSAGPSPTIMTGGGRITRFDPDRTVAVMVRECLPLALGAEFSVDLYPQPDPDGFDCDSAGVCDQYVQWVLSPADDMPVGGELLDEISVRVYPGLRVEVRRNRAPVETWRPDAGAPGQLLNIAASMAPTVDDGGTPVMQVTLDLQYGEQMHSFATDAIRIADLRNDPGCDEVPGLYVALQGRGTDAGAAGALVGNTLSCPNPGQFSPPTDARPLTRVELDWSTSFSAGGIEAPTIVSEGDDDPFWHVMAAASNEQPELGPGGFRVGYALGHSSTNFWNQPVWSLSSDGPRYGDDPPSCAASPASCPPSPVGSARDPFLHDVGDGTAFLVFAREIDPFMDPHAIYIAREPLDPMDEVAPTVLFRPDEVTGATCTSLRDPALLPTPDSTRYWLFYTCENANAPTIRAVRIDVLGTPTATATTDAEVLGPGAAGGFRSQGVRGPEPVLAFDSESGRAIVRLWFLGRDLDSTSVGVAIGEPKNLGMSETLGAFSPYPANPVLTPTDRAIDCATRECAIHGIAITDSPDATRPGLLRMLVARRVQIPGAGRFYDLFPVEQAWDPLQSTE